MRKLAILSALCSASALGIAATAAELQRGRLMRAPDHPYRHQDFPSWRYGPNGQSVIVNSEDETPAGWEDHPSKVGGEAGGGQGTAFESANGSISEEGAAKTTEAKSDTIVDPAVAAQSGVGGLGNAPVTGQGTGSPTPTPTPTPTPAVDLDSDGHPYDPALHAATKSKTKDGKWRMKVGVKRPDPAPGYPKSPAPLDL